MPARSYDIKYYFLPVVLESYHHWNSLGVDLPIDVFVTEAVYARQLLRYPFPGYRDS